MTEGHYKCTVAEPGEGERCGCVEKEEVILRSYECDINWDEDKMAECAVKAVVCQYSCNPYLPSYNPASCADCLSMGNYDCCGGDGWCTLCDFIEDCEKGEKIGDGTELLVFDYFEGGSCGD